MRPAGERGKMKNKAAVRAPAFGELHLVDTDTAALGKNVPRATRDRRQCAPAPQRLIKERRQEEPPGSPARRPRPLTRARGVAGTPMNKVSPLTQKVPACGASTSCSSEALPSEPSDRATSEVTKWAACRSWEFWRATLLAESLSNKQSPTDQKQSSAQAA